MGSSMSAIYDDYGDYCSLCKTLGISPLPMRNSESSAREWYDHYESLQKQSI
jgi:hypothetical protein